MSSDEAKTIKEDIKELLAEKDKTNDARHSSNSGKLDAVSGRVDKLDVKVDSLNVKVDATNTRFDSLTGELRGSKKTIQFFGWLLTFMVALIGLLLTIFHMTSPLRKLDVEKIPAASSWID